MTRDVVTVGPDTSAKYAAEATAERGCAALPVTDDDDRLVGIGAEAEGMAVIRRTGGLPWVAAEAVAAGR